MVSYTEAGGTQIYPGGRSLGYQAAKPGSPAQFLVAQVYSGMLDATCVHLYHL